MPLLWPGFFDGGGGGATEPVDPRTLFDGSSVGILIDFTDTSTLYTDTGGTTLVSSVGDVIRRANCAAGTGAFITTSRTDPKLAQGANDGYYMLPDTKFVTYDVSGVSKSASDWTFALGIKVRSDITTQARFFDSFDGRLGFGRNGSEQLAIHDVNGFRASTHVQADETPGHWAWRCTAAADTTEIFEDNALVHTDTFAATAAGGNTGFLSNYAKNGEDAGSPCVYALLIDRALTDNEMDGLDAWAQDKLENFA